jgi:hypothetical protein
MFEVEETSEWFEKTAISLEDDYGGVSGEIKKKGKYINNVALEKAQMPIKISIIIFWTNS